MPTELLESLLRGRLNGIQWRIMAWVVRQTYGWNRRFVAFSWYRIALDLGASRPAVYRAGKALLATRMLIV